MAKIIDSSYLKNKIEKSQQSFNTKIQLIANQFRREIIIPVCKKHNLCFYSGIGGNIFDKDGETLSPSHSKHSKLMRYELIGIFKALDLLVFNNIRLGSYVSDYTPPKKKRKFKKLRNSF